MPSPNDAPGARLARLWSRLAPFPGGKWLFSRILGLTVPYTASIGAVVRQLEPGFAQVELRDRRSVRNHLRSIHAVALVNLGEVTSGLAMLVGLPTSVRGIVIRLSIEYLKKARGTLLAESRVAIPTVTTATDYDVTADIKDPAGDVVARTTARWRLEPVL
jgi:acyl-coenzyme A thioesterase PaaI-like protein